MFQVQNSQIGASYNILQKEKAKWKLYNNSF